MTKFDVTDNDLSKYKSGDPVWPARQDQCDLRTSRDMNGPENNMDTSHQIFLSMTDGYWSDQVTCIVLGQIVLVELLFQENASLILQEKKNNKKKHCFYEYNI